MSTAAHTPPLGYAALTPVYDAMIGLMTREWAWFSEDAGFVRLCVLDDFATATGRIEILRAEKPAGVDRDRDRA